MRFVIVTGMSGGGKRTALRMLEDAGYYCVDNMPVPLVEKFAELTATPNSELTKVALGMDVRSDTDFRASQEMLQKLRGNGFEFEILYLDSSEETLIRRYKESRRQHPLAAENERIEDGIRKEREILEAVRSEADYVIDTSGLLTRELKEELDGIFVYNEDYKSLIVNIMSFGFKHGIPSDADIVLDVRFLPNPFYIEEMKRQTGLDEDVRKYVLQFEEAGIFLDKTEDLLRFLLPNYIKEGKYRLVVAIGCTGGRHRSVALAEALYERLKELTEYGVTISHRDIGK